MSPIPLTGLSVILTGGLLCALPAAAARAAGNEHIIYSFSGGADSGAPLGLLNVQGVLYGTTRSGGAYNGGTVFKLTLSGAMTTLHSFGQGSDGNEPGPSLINVGGELYGTTYNGGTNNYGTIYSITLAGAEKVIYSFPNDHTDVPLSLTHNANGFFGVTQPSQSDRVGGSVFRLTPAGVGIILHRFFPPTINGPDGSLPIGPLVGANGHLYGITFQGGTNHVGIVFSIHANGQESIVYTCADNSSGGYPVDLIAVNGMLYGTTMAGVDGNPGTFFQLSPAGAIKVLYNFKSSDGGYPAGLVYYNGAFYGTEGYGEHDHGMVFKIDLNGNETVLHAFGGAGDGNVPGNLIVVGGYLYGTTLEGGANNQGTVFRLAP